jgi:hypothetical protein
MKGIFPQYETHSAQEFSSAWKHGLFVFDTNVLLNLYRYQAATRDELINILGQLSKRIWVPHHVALEFQRNRLKVIAEQNRRFSEVRRTIEKARSSLFGELDKLQLLKRHSLINPQPLTSGFEKLVDTFLSELEALSQNQQKLTDPDPLKDMIENLFNGRVGTPPENQAAVDEIYKEADYRFKIKIPPGYGDSDKDKDEPDEHLHGGLIYKRKFGDYLVWRQVLAYAKENGVKQLILVTDDGKEDWWRKIDSDGPKTIGPRPELIEEASLKGEVNTFLMYNPEGFLKYAKEFLKAQVSEETLKEVRDVSIVRSAINVEFREFREFVRRAERSVFEWLLSRFERVEENRFGFPDFVAYRDGKRFGFEVKAMQNLRMLGHRLKETLYRAYYEIEENGLLEVTIVLIVSDPEDVEEVKALCMRIFREKLPSSIRVIIGVFDEDGRPEGGSFIPYDDFCWGETNNSL